MVLVERGQCDFGEKARRVQEAGAIGMIVRDDRLANSALITMAAFPATPAIEISCAFATFEDGLHLL